MPRRLLLIHPSRLEGENRGVYEQHVVSMQALLGDSHEWEVHALDLRHPSFPDAALAAELVIVHMLSAPEIEAVIRLRRARGLSTIFEISDNFLDMGGWLPARHALRNPLVRQRIVYHASIADAVQVYSPGLAALSRHLHDRVIELEPYVPLHDADRAVARDERDEHDDRRRRDERGSRANGGGGDGHERIVIGWGGSTSHEEDLAPVAPLIEDLCRRRDDVVFAFMGNLAMGERLFGGVPARQRRMREFGDFTAYLDFVRTWHIGLAPLRDSAFNACRTDTKLAIYAACGVAPVAEECDAYRRHGDHALLYRDAEGLREALDWLCDDRSRIDRLAERARKWAKRERQPERLRAQRISAYEPFIHRETGEPLHRRSTSCCDACRDTCRSKATIAAEVPLSVPVPLGVGAKTATGIAAVAACHAAIEAEGVCVEGVCAGQVAGDDPPALTGDIDTLRAIVRDHPEYAQARLTLADVLGAAGDERGALDALDVLDAGAFPPVLASLAAERQHALARRVRPERAGDYAARVDSPVARVRLDHGRSEPRAFLRKLLAQQPFDYLALSTRINELLAGDRDAEELRELCLRACLVAPELVPVDLRPSSLTRFLPAKAVS
jgi:hypothetical protein